MTPVFASYQTHICCGNRTGISITKHPASGKDLLNTHIMIHLPDTSVVVKAWLVLAVVSFLIVLVF